MSRTSPTAKFPTPGSWIFARDVLEWLGDRRATRQFPWLYRLLFGYFRLVLKLRKAQRIENGSDIFRKLVQWSRFLKLPRSLALTLAQDRVYLNLEDARFFYVVNELVNPQADPHVLAHLLKAGDTFFDVGANHGSFSLVAGRILGNMGKIVAVEAQPHLAELLQQSLESNLACSFQLHAVAVGDREGEIDFWVPLDSSGSAGQFPDHSASHECRAIRVKLQRFDDLIRPENYSKDGVLKIDIEGSEYSFLEGARKTIGTLTPKMILEINPLTLKASQVSGENLKRLLEELDYHHYAGLRNLTNLHPLDQLDIETHQNIVVFQNHHLVRA